MAPEKNILKTQNGECDETLIPLDHENNGQIRDFDLYHHFIRPMTKGVTVTCIIDCCQGGSVLDLPYHYCPDKDSIEMKKNMSSMCNLVLMHKLGGYSLPEAFDDNIVQDNVEYFIGKKLDDVHGLYSSDLAEDSILVGDKPKAAAYDAPSRPQNSADEEVQYTTCCCCCQVPVARQEQTAPREQTPPPQQQMYRDDDDDDDDPEELAIDLLLSDSFSSSDDRPPPPPPPPPKPPTDNSYSNGDDGLSSPLLQNDYGVSSGISYSDY